VLKHALTYGLALWLACIAGFPPIARADDNKEYLVKAAFIYNFIKYVEWPDNKAIGNQSHIDICEAGSNGLSSAGQVFKAASTSKLSLSLVTENNWANAAAHCHVLFISASMEDKLPQILAAIKGQPVLTVSDIDNFAESGGMIGFVENDNKIKLEINTKPVETANMRINAQLLEIALKVIGR